MLMKMTGDSCAGASTDVETHVEAIGVVGLL